METEEDIDIFTSSENASLKTTNKAKNPGKYRQIRPLWMAVFSDIIGFSLLIAVFPDFTRMYNITFLQVSIISSINGLFSFISAPIWGKLSDKYGRKPLLQISQAGTILGFMFLAFSNSYGMILISRIIDGIFGGNFPISKAVINDVVEPEDMAQEMTNIGIAHNVANLFAPALGGLLYSQFGLMGPGLAAAFTGVFTFTITLLRLPETAPIKTGITPKIIQKQRWNVQSEDEPHLPWYKHAVLVRALMILAFSSFGFMTIISNLANFGYKKFDLDTSQIGILLMMTAVIQIITRFSIYMPALKKWGEYRLAVVGFLLYLIEFTIFIFINRTYQFIIMLVFHSLATSATRGSISSFISNLANPWERGKVQGIASSIDTFAQIIGPLIGGSLLTYLPTEWFTSVSWVLMTISLILLLTAKDMQEELKKRNKNFHQPMNSIKNGKK